MFELSIPQQQIYQQEIVIGESVNTVCGCFFLKHKYSISDIEEALNKLIEYNDILRIV